LSGLGENLRGSLIILEGGARIQIISANDEYSIAVKTTLTPALKALVTGKISTLSTRANARRKHKPTTADNAKGETEVAKRSL